MRLVNAENRAHWYHKDGRACFEVPYADKKRAGETRATTLTDARKLGLLPSVTTILDVLSKGNLISWMLSQAIQSALTLPRNPDESLDDFAKRVVKDMDEQRDNAAEKGKAIEEAIRLWSIGESYEPALEPYVQAFRDFLKNHGCRIVWMQQRIVAPDYAGTADLMLEHIQTGRLVLADLKTQDGKKDEGKLGIRYCFYDTWCYQLEGYADRMVCDATMNIIIDRAHPGKFDFYEWTPDERKIGLENFRAAKTIFCNEKKYWPDRVKDAA